MLRHKAACPLVTPLFMPALRWWAGADISGVEGASAAGRGAGAGKKPFRLAANKAIATRGQKILPNNRPDRPDRPDRCNVPETLTNGQTETTNDLPTI